MQLVANPKYRQHCNITLGRKATPATPKWMKNVAINARIEKPLSGESKVCTKEKLKSKARLIMILQSPERKAHGSYQ